VLVIAIDDAFAAWVALLARVSIAAVFLVSGIHKGIWYEAAVAAFRRDRIPAIWFTLPATVVLHLVASICIIIGLFAREAALALAVFTIVATLKVHAYWRLPEAEQLARSRITLGNVAVVGGLLLLAAVGPGPIALAN
jgi:putative oxidoreductase